MRVLRDCCVSIAFVLAAAPATAAPIVIDVLSSQFTTSLTNSLFVPDDPSDESSSGTFVNAASDLTSSEPLADYLRIHDWVDAGATADFFGVTAYSQAFDAYSGASGATADAASKVTFLAGVDGVIDVTLSFVAGLDWIWAHGFAQLFDVTSNQELWAVPFQPFDEGTLAFESGPVLSVIAPTTFISSHVYELTLTASTSSNHDTASIGVYVSGLSRTLEVPEPPVLSLLCLSILSLFGTRGLTKRRFRSSDQPIR